MTRLNPFKIVWSVEVKQNGKIKFDHYANVDLLKTNLKASSGSTVYVITDKQFGMIQNSWNGVEKELPAPFKHKLVNRDGNKIQVIPLTEKQFKNPIHV